jgi:hypothetical protein
MSVFTDMEESIMDCWGVIDDLKAMAEGGEEAISPELLLAFAEVYTFKFSRLADLHEDALKEYYTLKGDNEISLSVDLMEELDLHGDLQW